MGETNGRAAGGAPTLERFDTDHQLPETKVSIGGLARTRFQPPRLCIQPLRGPRLPPGRLAARRTRRAPWPSARSSHRTTPRLHRRHRSAARHGDTPGGWTGVPAGAPERHVVADHPRRCEHRRRALARNAVVPHPALGEVRRLHETPAARRRRDDHRHADRRERRPAHVPAAEAPVDPGRTQAGPQTVPGTHTHPYEGSSYQRP